MASLQWPQTHVAVLSMNGPKVGAIPETTKATTGLDGRKLFILIRVEKRVKCKPCTQIQTQLQYVKHASGTNLALI